MRIRVAVVDGHPRAEVLEVDDLTRLSVRLDGVALDAAGPALQEGGLGNTDGDHAWLVVDRLRAAGPADPAWTDRFTAMMQYAAGKDWLDSTGTRVRAHVESGPDASRG